MEPLTLAAAVVGLLVAFFQQATGKLAERAGDAIADATLPKVAALHNRLRAKLAPNSYQAALLNGLQAEPHDVGRQGILQSELAKLIVQDQRFASELEHLVAEAERAGVHIRATDAGVVAGRDVHQRGQFVAGRDMTIVGNDQRATKPIGEIQKPNDGDQVPRRFTAKGVVSNIPRGHSVWLAVEINGLLWPKPPLIGFQDNHWTRTIHEAGVARAFSLVLLQVDAKGKEAIETWIDHGVATTDWPGLSSIPGSSRLDAVVDLTSREEGGHPR